MIPLEAIDRYWCLGRSYTHILQSDALLKSSAGCLPTSSELNIQTTKQLFYFLLEKTPALCKTSPLLLTRFYSTISSKSDSSSTRESAQLFVHAVRILCLDHYNSQAPKTAATILQGLLLPSSPSHSTNFSSVTPYHSRPPQVPWAWIYQIQNPTYKAEKGSACCSNSTGASTPHVFKTNLFKTSLTSTLCY